MRNILLIILLTVICTSNAFSQSKTQRRIYLWDVTLSMKGYKEKTPDIYDDIVKFLKREINSLTDESTEIIVLPFQERILENWVVKATPEGKKSIISKIENYNNEDVTNTNIVEPIKVVESQYIKSDKHNMLFLLTDGKQSGGNIELLSLIRDWEEYAVINDAYAVYVMLTEQAVDNKVIDTIRRTPGIDVITTQKKFDWIDLQPSQIIRFNIKDDFGKQSVIPLVCKKNIVLPEGVKVSVKSVNDTILNINEVTEIKNLKLSYMLNYDEQQLKHTLPERIRIPLRLELLNQQEIKEKTGKIVLLNPTDIELELINKPEKTLRIHVKN